MSRATPPPPTAPAPAALPPPEQACELAGRVVADLIAAPAAVPAAAALTARLERALLGEEVRESVGDSSARGRRMSRAAGAPVRGARRRVVLALGLAGAAAAALVAAARFRALGYGITGAAAVAEGRVSTAAAGAAAIRFTDGTIISLGEQSAGRVAARTHDGATFRLERGHASLNVVHRSGARWRVEAGPFDIAVTGTRFDVRWAPERGRLAVELLEGSVLVRGALAGSKGVPLRAGQRLTAGAAGDELTVESMDGAASGRAPAAPALPGAAASPSPAAADSAGAGASGSPAGSAGPGAAGAAGSSGASASAAARAGGAAVERRTRRAEPALAPAPAARPEDLSGSTDDAELALGAPKRERLMNAGGELCKTFQPQFGFERWTEGFTVAGKELLALRNRSLDHAHSWCGNGSLRVDADFRPAGTRNAAGMLPYEAGQVMVRLGQPVDLTGKLVVMHVFVDAPASVQFGVQVFAVNQDQGKWIAGGVDSNIAPGRWWTVRASFEGQQPPAGTSASPLTQVDGLAFQIYSTGAQRTWTGTVYIDDVGWK